MSLLLQLPTEIQFHILSYLGPEFFRQDVRRLRVSRLWYGIAWRIMVQDLRLTTGPLMKFTQERTVLARSQAFVTSVQLSLWEFEAPRPSARAAGRVAEPCSAENSDEWTVRLNSSWEALATTLQGCPSLRRLRIEGPKGHPLDPRQQGISFAKPLADLLSVGHLTHLEIDTTGSSHSSPSVHLCRSIGALLPKLRRLRCRMGSICEYLLEPQPTNDEPLQLEEAILNLSLSELSETVTSYRYTKCCEPNRGGTFLQLKEAIETKATKLSRRLINPRVVRVISHELPSLTMYAFDAPSGKRIRLRRGCLPWDTDGEVVYESDSADETDLFDSDSVSTPELVL